MGFSLMRKGLVVAGLLGAAASAPALADVKAGADAWGRGDFPAAVREWQPLADKGDPDAQFNMAQAYKLGRGVPQDLTRAEMLYAKAAAQGHLQAGDNYGLLLFQRGQHAAALPYIRAASDRGDPRSQYLLGLAYFNADGVNKDWVRAYALESLAAQPTSGAPGLPQAKAALSEMDKYIAIEDRQRAISLATELAAQVEANRQRQLAAVDLGTPNPPVVTTSTATPVRAVPTGMAGNMRPAQGVIREPAPAPVMPREPAPRPVLATAAPVGLPPAPAPRVAAPRPAPMAVAVAEPAPKATPMPAPKPTPAPKPALAPKPAPHAVPVGGPWKLQLGAFGVAGNADALWARVKSMPEIAGHPRANVPVGKVMRLLATGYSEENAQSACRKLTGAGLSCMAVKD
ncbi:MULTISPECIES: SPOR domain-containing protein [unclassified Novosphingobium]|uniref:SPOR domain-containing protein n=1 Tax=unclassified Novosphingobium TaxID=2644732 RepID=UPI000AF78B84|nr:MULTISPECIES: SPOR domain-containing protein [unclassified Novosphingobium]MDR6709453.1 cell division septation protein DedD [Novosphingobium sp. 1748]